AVQAGRLRRAGAELAEDEAEVVDAQRPRREHAHAARVRDGNDQRRVRRRPAHRRLEDRVLDAEELGDARFHRIRFSIWISAPASVAILVSAASKSFASLDERQLRTTWSRSAAARISPL